MVLVLGLVSAGYTVLAWRLGRARGSRGLVQAWLGSTLVVTALAVASATHHLAVIRPLQSRDVLNFAALYLLVFIMGLGAVTWFVQRRLRLGPVEPLGVGAVLGAVLSFYAGLLVLAVPLLLWDALRLF
jgi:hypothetical protein